MNIQDWTLYYDNFGPLSCQAPCTMYSVLYDHGKIPDPFYGTNERELQYLAEKDCVFESVFSAPPALLTREHIELVFHGLDTICHIYLNGTLLGKVKNMHREYVYEVKPLLTAGENTLRLEFKSPRRYFAQQQHKHYLYMNDGDTLPGAAHLRKAMYQSGWDWGSHPAGHGHFPGRGAEGLERGPFRRRGRPPAPRKRQRLGGAGRDHQMSRRVRDLRRLRRQARSPEKRPRHYQSG